MQEAGEIAGGSRVTSPTLFKRMTLALLRRIDSRRARGQGGQISEEAALTVRLRDVEAGSWRKWWRW